MSVINSNLPFKTNKSWPTSRVCSWLIKLYISHAKWSSPDHFETIGCEDDHPIMLIRFDFTSEGGWKKWRHGDWLPIKNSDVPTEVMVRYAQGRRSNENAVV